MRFAASAILAFLLGITGCASNQMYTYDGLLTTYGGEQTNSEIKSVSADCKSSYEKLDSDRYSCMRKLLPLRLRWSESHADLTAAWLEASTNVAAGYVAGNISAATAMKIIDELYAEYGLQNDMLNAEYDKIIGARNAREKYAARQRTANAFSQLGSDLLKQSSSGSSITCTETMPGTVECSE